jgi:hypothetical protein
MESLAEMFKCAFASVAFLDSARYRQTWISQVRQIDEYWDEMILNADPEKLKSFLNLKQFKKSVDERDFMIAIDKALTDWRIELMTRVANQITQFSNDETEGDFVKWNGSEMELSFDVKGFDV